MKTLWSDPTYFETGMWVLGILFLSAIPVYYFRNRNHYFISAWASIKSWLFAAPAIFFIFGLPEPWILVMITLTALFGAKAFFKMMGMYHRIWFVVTCYLAMIGLGLSIHFDRPDLYNLMPMILLGVICLFPIWRNSYKNMLQFIALTLICFMFLGWAFMHIGLIARMENGLFHIAYLIILTEFFDNTVLATARHVGKRRIFDKIAQYRTVESTVLAAILTMALAYAMRSLLQHESDTFWLATGVIAIIFGSIGHFTVAVFLRDLGVKLTGAFILGRSDFLRRADRLIFVAPCFYYGMKLIDLVNQ